MIIAFALDANIFIGANEPIRAITVPLAEQANVIFASSAVMTILVVGAFRAQSFVTNSVALVVR